MVAEKITRTEFGPPGKESCSKEHDSKKLSYRESSKLLNVGISTIQKARKVRREGLVADIRENGLNDPVETWHGQIIDGVHRAKACKEAGVEVRVKPWDGKESELKAHVVTKNVHRRHMSISQRAMVAEKISPRGRGSRVDVANTSDVSRPQAAAMLNVGEATVGLARKVRREGIPKLAQAVESGHLTVNEAARIADLPKAKQHEVLNVPKCRKRR